MNPFIKYDKSKTKTIANKTTYTPAPADEQKLIPLSIADYRIYETPTFEDFQRSFKYALKHFEGYNLEYDKVMLFKKMKKNPNDKFFAKKRAEVAKINRMS